MSAPLPRLLAVVSKVKEAAESFKNPMFRYYFAAKATEELQLLQEKGASLSASEIESKLRLNEDLEAQLRRQSTIHNFYYEAEGTVKK